MDGYMIEVDFDGATLRVHPKNKAAAVALLGAERNSGDLTLARLEIAGVDLKPAKTLSNGCLTVRIHDGRRYQLHTLKKHQADFAALAAALP
jgi:hypothetical protein